MKYLRTVESCTTADQLRNEDTRKELSAFPSYQNITEYRDKCKVNLKWLEHTPILLQSYKYCGVAARGRSIERPLLINGNAYLAVSLPDNGQVDSNS
jgi:hypothetical protein